MAVMSRTFKCPRVWPSGVFAPRIRGINCVRGAILEWENVANVDRAEAETPTPHDRLGLGGGVPGDKPHGIPYNSTVAVRATKADKQGPITECRVC